jgi:hypothetical protein
MKNRASPRRERLLCLIKVKLGKLPSSKVRGLFYFEAELYKIRDN